MCVCLAWHNLAALLLKHQSSNLGRGGGCRMFEVEDLEAPFKHFFPQFPDSDVSLAIASSINMAVVLR